MTLKETKEKIIAQIKAVRKAVQEGTSPKELRSLKRPIFLLGDRGIGKTQTIEQIAEEVGLPLHVFRLAECSVIDIAGMRKVLDDGQIIDIPPAFPLDEPIILFFDELNRQLDPEVRNAVFRLLEEGKVRNWSLHPETVIIVAGNPPNENYTDVVELDSAMIDRFTLLEVRFDKKEFISFIKENKWEEIVIEFLEQAEVSDIFQAPDPEGKKVPTPRAWEAVNAKIKHGIVSIPPKGTDIQLIAGDIGMTTTLKFVKFCEDKKKQETETFTYEDFIQKKENVKEFFRKYGKKDNLKIEKGIKIIVEGIEKELSPLVEEAFSDKSKENKVKEIVNRFVEAVKDLWDIFTPSAKALFNKTLVPDSGKTALQQLIAIWLDDFHKENSVIEWFVNEVYTYAAGI